MENNTTLVQSIVRAADVLACVRTGGIRLTDICSRLNLSKATAHRLLKTLKSTKLITQDPVSNRYFLGNLVVSLASTPFIAHQALIAGSYQGMHHLREISGETVALHMQVGAERLCLEELQSHQHVKYTSGKGYLSPLYVGSAGKAILAQLEEDKLNSFLKYVQLDPLTANNVPDKETLKAEVGRVRRQGYALSAGERVPGAAAISIPVRGYICPVALSILGPEDRFASKRLDFLAELKMSAGRISRNLDGDSADTR